MSAVRQSGTPKGGAQVAALFAQAQELAKAEKSSEAIARLVQVLALDADHMGALELLYDVSAGVMKKGSANPLTALIAATPQILTLHSVAVRICRLRGDYVERLAHMEALYDGGIRGDLFYQEYGAMLCHNGLFERSLAVAQEGLASYPDSIGLRKVRAHLMLSLGRRQEALADWEDIAQRAPEDHQARLSVGIVKLLISNGGEGFADYAAHRDRALVRHCVQMPAGEWKGESLAGKRLFLWSSQGVGDIIMFAGMVPWVVNQGAQVTLMVPQKLTALFARSFPRLRIVAQEWDKLAALAGECDYHCVLGQLMQHVLPHYTPAQHPAFLKADGGLAARLRAKYLAVSPQREATKLVGISWDTQNKDTFSQRNIALESWDALLSLPHIQFVSLQYGDHAATLAAMERKFPGALYLDADIDAYENMDGLAAQITAMDEVVSIQNVTVHLAGALGVETTLMLSSASDWRWGLNSTESRWYRSVWIERQKTLLDWKPVLRAVRKRLMA